MGNALVKDVKLFLFFSLFFGTTLWAQQFESSFLLSADGILSSEENNPFWMSHNNYFKISSETSFAGFGQWKGTYELNEKSGLNAVISGYYRDGVSDEFQRKELNVSYKNPWLKVTLGSEVRLDPTNGLSATGKNFLWSPNARPLPGIIIEANEPALLGQKFMLDWGIGHYLLNDDRYVDNTMVHYKRLALQWNINEKNSLRGQLQHFAQWGGTSPEYGELEDDFNAFVDVFFASQPESSVVEGEAANALGNHLGSYLIDYKFATGVADFSLYHEHPFEDGSGTAFANFPDGVWGLYATLAESTLIKNICIEYIDTSDQSGNTTGSGYDGYFGNNVYRSGWTYEGNIIGVPLLGIDPNIEITSTTSPFVSNRIRAIHVGVDGAFKGFQWQLKTTYNQSYGTYRAPFPETLKNWYNYLAVQYPTEIYGTFQVYSGLDLGNEKDTFGIGLSYAYSF